MRSLRQCLRALPDGSSRLPAFATAFPLTKWSNPGISRSTTMYQATDNSSRDDAAQLQRSISESCGELLWLLRRSPKKSKRGRRCLMKEEVSFIDKDVAPVWSHSQAEQREAKRRSLFYSY